MISLMNRSNLRFLPFHWNGRPMQMVLYQTSQVFSVSRQFGTLFQKSETPFLLKSIQICNPKKKMLVLKVCKKLMLPHTLLSCLRLLQQICVKFSFRIVFPKFCIVKEFSYIDGETAKSCWHCFKAYATILFFLRGTNRCNSSKFSQNILHIQ